MDGSQLPTEWTHLNVKLVGGVSDSKMRDVSQNKNATASKNGPMTKKLEDVNKMSKMTKSAKSSQKSDVAKSSENGTILQSEKSSTTFEGDVQKNADTGLF